MQGLEKEPGAARTRRAGTHGADGSEANPGATVRVARIASRSGGARRVVPRANPELACSQRALARARGNPVKIPHARESSRYDLGMSSRTSLVRAALVAGIVSVPFASDAFTLSAIAQSTTGAPKVTAKTPYDATITADSALVRAAPSTESGYPFGSLRQGASVRVLEEQVGWVAVSLAGGAFDGWFGYVQAAPGVTLSADGKTLKVSSRAQISAPNAEANWNPDSSWKAIGFLVAGDEVAVLGESKGQRDTYYKVALTAKATGWINASAISPAANATPASETATPKVDSTTTTSESPVQAGEKVDAATTTTDTNPVDPDPTQDVTADPTTTDATTDATTTATTDATKTVRGTSADAINREKVVERVRRVKFNDIDTVWKRVAKEPVETAELEQLRERFLALAEDANTPRSEAIASTRRAEQIAMRIDVQKGLLEIAALRQKANASMDGVANLELAMKTRQPWDAVGRLNASSIYNGERLPLLYRLQDQGTGQTIAYILPTPEFDLPSMLGLLIGVKGPIRYDDSLRLNTIAPTQIGPLTARDINPNSAQPSASTPPADTTAIGSEGASGTAK